MPKMVLEVAKEFGVLPEESLILVEIVDIQEREVPAYNGREGWTKLEFKCVIRDLPANLKNDEAYSELIGANIFASTTARFTTHPDNKLRQWTEAILNMGELDAGFELDTDMLLHRQAKAVTSTYTKKDGQKRHQIDGFLPPGPLGGAPAMPSFFQQPATPATQPQPQPNFAQQPAQQAAPQQSPQVPAWATTAESDDPPF